MKGTKKHCNCPKCNPPPISPYAGCVFIEGTPFEKPEPYRGQVVPQQFETLTEFAQSVRGIHVIALVPQSARTLGTFYFN